MTRATNARIAGFTFFIYLAAGLSMMALGRAQATGVLALFTSFSALVLGVTLYAITREQDPDIALLALGCRIIEAIPGEGTIYFAAGSLLFCWLLLRGRMIPVTLAWLGIAASALLVVILPLQRAGLAGGPTTWASSVTWLMWLPMLVFEVGVGLWFIFRGVAAPRIQAAGTLR